MAAQPFWHRPDQVQAVQWTGTNATEIVALVGANRFTTTLEPGSDQGVTGVLFDSASMVWTNIANGMWVLLDADGNTSALDNVLFTRRYAQGTYTASTRTYVEFGQSDLPVVLLAVGGTTSVPVTWTAAMPGSTYDVRPVALPKGLKLDSVGSKSASGCTVVLKATVALTVGGTASLAAITAV